MTAGIFCQTARIESFINSYAIGLEGAPPMEHDRDLQDRIMPSSYRAPEASDVREIPSDRAGVTNGLFLRFPVLYAVGDLSLLERPCVAIVGARKATREGVRRAEQLARDLVRAGIVVVSGLAAGIDRAAHQSAIQNGGRTIAVVGTPLDKAYPKEHAELQQLIYQEHLLVSQFRWGDPFVPANFPERNRVMARLAKATVIVEASDTSGSLHQAAESVLVGHPVFIAESVTKNPALKWPARFIGKPHGFVLSSAADVIQAVQR